MAIPRPEYPRPTLVRGDESWVNLNGTWEFEFDFGNSGRERKQWEGEFTKEITVPFAPESKLSGIEHIDFIPAVWYRRKVTIPADWCTKCGKVLLQFGAVDYHCEVYVNGNKAGDHIGGYTPFTVDITKFVNKGEEATIAVYAEDNGFSDMQPTGKQVYYSYYNAGCHYTRSTGIWQTVWMEYVPANYIRNVKITPDIENEKIDVIVSLEGGNSAIDAVSATVLFDGKEVSAANAKVTGKEATFSVPVPNPVLWAPGEPNLYDLKVTAGKDEAVAYFGMRSVRINGYAIEINNKPVFQRLVLDQGYYIDGIYTAPTDADLKKDIELSMAAGFNGARLHMKVFEPRLLYWADKLGYIVWGEFPNWGLDETQAASLNSILPEWLTELDRDYNHPAIVGWCPFNETNRRRNAQVFRTMYYTTRAIDPMRPIIDTSGYVHAITDIYDVHDYDQNPVSFKQRYVPLANGEEKVWVNNPDIEHYDGQPFFVSEFGGILWRIDQDAKDRAWGYGESVKTMDEYYARFQGLVDALLDNPKMCAFCYTQLTDVFQEQNGIYAFDRRAKFDCAKLHAIMSRKAAIEK